MSTGLSFLLQTQKSKFVIENKHKIISVHQHKGNLQVRPDPFLEAVSCVIVVLKWNRGKMLQSVGSEQ